MSKREREIESEREGGLDVGEGGVRDRQTDIEEKRERQGEREIEREEGVRV